ncbi:Uncharacterized SAM-binding protein YcdF, DUF218 family [Ruminococcus sp. YE71]|uniref:YdcF family protein n=1 Tax=unclassified Ruminococcus TaxID=2608920 RepID=UPI00088663C8|nr:MULTISPECIES: YdcF family protein [unclassified Ruminococcus]SDA17525.1 Uncharacterized SAM-binding protein YcdF, DUF218 family [Ruminococcus sp. YE78]SFW26969.1 Uncharacterized SAM-binding protein YcdF, DUF218 family [Ruminococcus sp. YE71]
MKIKKYLRLLLLIPEFLLLGIFNAAAPIYNEGNISAIAFIIVLMFVTVCFDGFAALWKTKVGKAVLSAVMALTAAGFLYAGVLSGLMYNAMTNTPEDPKVIVVLGCQVQGTQPSRMLARRLDAAFGIMQEYPDAQVIVSGGRGSGEAITEAECMKKYLTAKGADPDRIITEDKSTSTAENLRYSLALTDERDITIVSDGYHQYRASLIAKAEGAESVTAISADTEKRFLPTYWVREWLGITHFFLLGR